MDLPRSTNPVPSVTISTVTSGTPVQQTPVDVTRLIYMLYQDIEQQISRSDLKAQITLSTSAILAAVMSNLGLGMATWRIAEMSTLDIAALIAWVTSAGCLCFAIGYALSAAFPRSAGKSATPLENPNLYFSAHLVQLSPAVYAERFCAQTNQEVKLSTLQQIHVKSTVLEAKLLCVRRGLLLLVTALACWALARLLLLISSEALEVPKQMLSSN